MHEQELSLAYLPKRHRVFGLPMLPFSLGHELILTREQSPFSGKSFQGGITREDVARAAFICCQTFQELTARNNLSDAIKTWVWRFRAKSFNEDDEAIKFVTYKNESYALPEHRNAPLPEGMKATMTGTPMLFQLIRFVMGMGYSETEALNYPMLLARWHWLAKQESDGLVLVESEYDAHIKRLQKGEYPCPA